MIMLKDNHIVYCGGIEKAINKAYDYLQSKKIDLKIEVETRSIDDVEKVMAVGKVNRIKVQSTIHQGILCFITNERLNNYYLEKYLIFIQPFISSFSSSNTQENLNIDKIKNLINSKSVIYDHRVDQTQYKFGGGQKLEKIDLEFLPRYISSNKEKYLDWLER